MNVPTINAVAAGDVFRADDYNNQVKRSIDLVKSPPRAFIHQASTPTSIANTTWVNLAFDGMTFDTDYMYSASYPTRLTVTCPGLYEVLGQINYGNPGSAGGRAVRLLRSGAQVAYSSQAGVPATGVIQISSNVPMKAGEYLEMGMYHNAGAGVTLSTGNGFNNTFLTMRWVARA